MEKRTRKTALCVKCGNEGEIKAFNECIACYNARRRTKKKFEWSYSHPFCVVCKTTKYKHHGKGFCTKCRLTHDVVYIANQKKWNKIKNSNLTEEQKKKRLIKDRKWRKRTKDKQELYKATQRGLKLVNNSLDRINGDIKILKKATARLKC